MKKSYERLNHIVEYIFRTEVLMSILLLCIVTLIACKMPEMIEKGETQTTKNSQGKEIKSNGRTVIIDPGHGGIDPGKIGVNKELEKDINLSIALKLKQKLEDTGYRIVMTREQDTGLYEETDSNKKRADMKNRCTLINTEFARDNKVINVSIHQNSYPTEAVKGPQVFYYSKSENGAELAKILQNQLNQKLEVDRPRTEKANDNYYMLVHTDCPSVIVECGFLSNWEEAEKLKNDTYQEEFVEILTEGINEYYAD